MALTMRVLIAAYGQPELLRRTLRSLCACEKPAGYAGVIVIENGARSGLAQVVAEFGAEQRFKYLYSAPANKSLALNYALDLVREGLCVFTDDDVVVPRGTLVAYARAGNDYSAGRFFGGPIVPDYEAEPPAEWLRPYLPRSAAGWRLDTQSVTEIQRPEFIGPNFAAFAEDILRVGGFDPRLGPGRQMASPGEDTEIQARLLASGVRGFYVSEAAMQHFVRAGSTTLEFAVHRAERNGIYWGIERARQPGLSSRALLKIYGQWLNDLWRIRRWRGSADQGTRARADFVAARWRGRWEGIRIGRAWQKAGEPTATVRRAA
jgi:glycosyltransferase involved in cell wall biosynthesis